jgi:hypothetical protein
MILEKTSTAISVNISDDNYDLPPLPRLRERVQRDKGSAGADHDRSLLYTAASSLAGSMKQYNRGDGLVSVAGPGSKPSPLN